MEIRFERQSLYHEVWSAPLTQLAKKYGMSDNGIRKVCKAMNIPLPRVGHWAKIAAGQVIPKTPLPSHTERSEFISCLLPSLSVGELAEERLWLKERESFEKQDTNRIVVDLQRKQLYPLIVPFRDRLHRLVNDAEKAKKDAEKEKTRPANLRAHTPNFGRLNFNGTAWRCFTERGQLLEPAHNRVPFRVTPVTWERALAIISALVYAAEDRGITAGSNTAQDELYFEIDGVSINVRISEKLESENRKPDALTPLSRVLGRDQIKVPTGILRLYLWARWSSEFEIKETNENLLQDKLNAVFCRIYRLVVKYHFRKRMAVESRRQSEEEERRRMEEARLRTEEIQQRKALLADVANWQASTSIRDYLCHLKRVALDSGMALAPDSDLGRWLVWAETVALELDPVNIRLSNVTRLLNT